MLQNQTYGLKPNLSIEKYNKFLKPKCLLRNNIVESIGRMELMKKNIKNIVVPYGYNRDLYPINEYHVSSRAYNIKVKNGSYKFNDTRYCKLFYYIEDFTLYLKIFYRENLNEDFDIRTISFHKTEFKHRVISIRALIRMIEKKADYPDFFIYYRQYSCYDKFLFFKKLSNIANEFFQLIGWFNCGQGVWRDSIKYNYRSNRLKFIDNYFKK